MLFTRRNLFRVFEYLTVGVIYLASLAFMFGGINSMLVNGVGVFVVLITGFATVFAVLSAKYLLDEFGDGILLTDR